MPPADVFVFLGQVLLATPLLEIGMKLHIGSGHLQGDIDALHLHDEASVELLRLGRVTKARRQGRSKNFRSEDDLHTRKRATRRDGPEAGGAHRHDR